jgi:hypothetical protein
VRDYAIELLRLEPWSRDQADTLIRNAPITTHVMLTFGAADAVRVSLADSQQPPPPSAGAAQVLRRVVLHDTTEPGAALSLAEFWAPSLARSHPVLAVISCRIAATTALSLQLRGARKGPVGFGGAAALAQQVVREVDRALSVVQIDEDRAEGQFLFGAYPSEDPEVITVLVRGRTLPAALRATDAVHRVTTSTPWLHALAKVLGGRPAQGPEATFDAASSLIGMELCGFTGAAPPAWLLPHSDSHRATRGFGLIQGDHPEDSLGPKVQLHADLHVRNGAAAAGLADFRAMLQRDLQIVAGAEGEVKAPKMRYPLGAASARATVTIRSGTTATLAQLLLSRITDPGGSGARRSPATVSTVLSAGWDPASTETDEGGSHPDGDPLRIALDEALEAVDSRLFDTPAGRASDDAPRAPKATRGQEAATTNAGPHAEVERTPRPAQAHPGSVPHRSLRSAMAALRREPSEFTMLASLIEAYLQLDTLDPKAQRELDRVLETIQTLHPLRARDPVEAWAGSAPLEAPWLRRAIERLSSAVRLWSQRFPADGAWKEAGGGPTALVLRAQAARQGAVHAEAITADLLIIELPQRRSEVEVSDLFLAPAYAEAQLSLTRWPELWDTLEPWYRPIEELALSAYRTPKPKDSLKEVLEQIGRGFGARSTRDSGGLWLRLLGEVLTRTVALLLGLLVFVDEARAAGLADPRGAACRLAAQLIAAETATTEKRASQTLRGASLVLLICECAVDLPVGRVPDAAEAPLHGDPGDDAEALVAGEVRRRVQLFLTLVKALELNLSSPGGVQGLSGEGLPSECAGANERMNALRDMMGAQAMPWAVELLTLLTELGVPAKHPERPTLQQTVLEQMLLVVWRLDERRRQGAVDAADGGQRFHNGAAALRALTRALAGASADPPDAVLDAVLDVGYDTGISALARLLRSPGVSGGGA